MTDYFHLWSRHVFDGKTVIKIDIDGIAIDQTTEKIISLVEIKCSAKVPVGEWVPFQKDYSNYRLLMDFADLLQVKMITIHHDVKDENRGVTDDTMVDVFTYFPNSSDDKMASFLASRQLITAKEAFLLTQ